MRLEQHVYTGFNKSETDTEFVTIAKTKNLDRQALNELERHSVYMLPAKLHHMKLDVYPVKHVYYPLDE